MYSTYRGGFAPRIGTVQNAQAPPEFFSKFLTLPQIISTSLAKQKGNILYKNCTVGAVLVLRYRLYPPNALGVHDGKHERRSLTVVDCNSIIRKEIYRKGPHSIRIRFSHSFLKDSIRFCWIRFGHHSIRFAFDSIRIWWNCSVIDSIRFGFGTDSYRVGFDSFVIRFGVDSVKG